MMKVIKGFASHAKFVSNTKDQVHPIGEISANALTYAKDRGIYAQDEDISLITFRSTEDAKYKPLNQDWQDHIFTVINDIYHQVFTAGTTWGDNVSQYLIDKFASTATNFEVGPIVEDGNYVCPSWISWQRVGFADNIGGNKIGADGVTSDQTNEGGKSSYIRIWFSDPSFQDTFDEYEFTVVPPIEVYDNFFKSKATVVNLLNTQNDPISMADRTQTKRNDQPETILRTFKFEWHNPLNTEDTLVTFWNVLIYGAAGNNVDAIKDALQKDILDNSDYPRDNWVPTFPEIFRRTEFIIFPQWNNWAIEEKTLTNGIYSAITRRINEIPMLTAVCSKNYGYTDSHIEAYATVMGQQYRSLMCFCVSNPENRDKLYWLTDLFPDYINVNSLSQDFNRMIEYTRTWSDKLNTVIIEAEKATPYSALPKGITRLTRDGVFFLVLGYDNINYLVVTKYNVNGELPYDGDDHDIPQTTVLSGNGWDYHIPIKNNVNINATGWEYDETKIEPPKPPTDETASIGGFEAKTLDDPDMQDWSFGPMYGVDNSIDPNKPKLSDLIDNSDDAMDGYTDS